MPRWVCPNCGNTKEEYFEDNGVPTMSRELTIICKAPVKPGDETLGLMRVDLEEFPDLVGICNEMFMPNDSEG